MGGDEAGGVEYNETRWMSEVGEERMLATAQRILAALAPPPTAAAAAAARACVDGDGSASVRASVRGVGAEGGTGTCRDRQGHPGVCSSDEQALHSAASCRGAHGRDSCPSLLREGGNTERGGVGARWVSGSWESKVVLEVCAALLRSVSHAVMILSRQEVLHIDIHRR